MKTTLVSLSGLSDSFGYFRSLSEVPRMVRLASRDGASIAPDVLVRAVSQLAERQADLTADWLESAGHPPGPLNVPAAFLLELAAVLQLGQWERQNVLVHLDANLPSYRQAADELANRAALGPKEFHGPDATRLSFLVNTVWIERFAWDGPPMLHADIVFGDCDDDALVEQLAGFLWQHRVDLQKLTVNEAGDEPQ